MRRTSEPEEKTMYMHQMCGNCVGQGTVADRQTLKTKTCGVCGGIGQAPPQAVQVWEYPQPSRVKRLWNRSLLRSAVLLVGGVLCGMFGALVMDLLLKVV